MNMRAVLSDRPFFLGDVWAVTEETHAEIEESVARKERSISLLKTAGVPTIDHLPRREAVRLSVRRSKSDVVGRLLALTSVSVLAQEFDLDGHKALMARLGGTPAYSDKELSFVANPREQDRVAMSWRFEGLGVLLWALGFFPELGLGREVFDQDDLAQVIVNQKADGLQQNGALREQSELLDALDIAYRLHWAVTDAHLKQQEMPAGLNGAVVYERRYALEWLAGYGDDWDEVPTDT